MRVAGQENPDPMGCQELVQGGTRTTIDCQEEGLRVPGMMHQQHAKLLGPKRFQARRRQAKLALKRSHRPEALQPARVDVSIGIDADDL